jgi:hypothetical protein
LAKVTIEIKDNPDGTMTITSSPPIQKLNKMEDTGEFMANSHHYALFCLRLLYAKLKGKISSEKIRKN